MKNVVHIMGAEDSVDNPVISTGNEVLQFSVPLDGASFSRTGNDLVITMHDNSYVILNNYFGSSTGGLPSFLFVDGTYVSGADWLRSFSPDMDLTTAASGASNPNTNSLGAYADHPGALLDGVNRLGSLGTSHWDRNTEPHLGLAGHEKNLATLSTDTGVVPVNYIARAVLHITEPGAGITAVFRLLENGKAIDPAGATWSVEDRNGYFDQPFQVNADGTISMTLNANGLVALQVNPGCNIYEYLTFTVNGSRYSMQVVVNQDGHFNSHFEDALDPPGAPILGEWHTEFNGSGNGYRLSSGSGDEFWYTSKDTSAVFTGTLVTGAGDDTINLDGQTAMGKGFIDAGSGADHILINGDILGGSIAGGADSDSIRVHGSLNNWSKVGGDASGKMENTVSSGQDTIHISGSVKNSSIGGDAAEAMKYSHGGDLDHIIIDDLPASEKLSDVYVAGDAAGGWTTASRGGDGDIIQIFSKDNVNKAKLVDWEIGGDGINLKDGSVGGAGDMIEIHADLYTEVSDDVHGIGGDASNSMIKSSGGARDIISIHGDVYNGLSIGGDAGVEMYNSIGGAEDLIEIVGNISGKTGEMGNAIGGDAGRKLSGGKGGDGDTISITGNLDIAMVGGDAGCDLVNGAIGGNNDYITITGNMPNSFVGGDAGDSMINSTGGSGDSISINGIVGAGSRVGGDAGYRMISSTGGGDNIYVETLAGGKVGGDAGESMFQSTGGNDTIHINTMQNGVVAGDAASIMDDSDGGDDFIHVDVMHGGSIYGDGLVLSGTSTGGNDTVSVSLLAGASAKIIDGNSGNDLFIYEHAEGHLIELSDSGQVTIWSADKNTNITSSTNTSIVGFEGIGGGAGNDILVGSQKNDLLVGGLGFDTLTGGKGADIFGWYKADLDGSTDLITDFSLAEGDRIALEDMLTNDTGTLFVGSDIITGNIDGLGKLIVSIGSTQTIEVDMKGALFVGGKDYADFNEFADAWTAAGHDQGMLDSLLAQMLTTW